MEIHQIQLYGRTYLTNILMYRVGQMTCSDTIMEARKIYVFLSEGGSGRVHFMSFHLSDNVFHVFAKIMQPIHSKKASKTMFPSFLL